MCLLFCCVCHILLFMCLLFCCVGQILLFMCLLLCRPISVFLFCLCLYFFLYDWFSLLVSCICNHLFGCPVFVCFVLLQSFTWLLIIHLLIHIFVRYFVSTGAGLEGKKGNSFLMNIYNSESSVLYFLLGVATKSVPELQGFVKPSLEPGVSGRSK